MSSERLWKSSYVQSYYNCPSSELLSTQCYTKAVVSFNRSQSSFFSKCVFSMDYFRMLGISLELACN